MEAEQKLLKNLSKGQLQRVKIAKILGWKNLHWGIEKHVLYGENSKYAPSPLVPDYSGDLNAVAQMEEFLKRRQCDEYTAELARILKRDNFANLDGVYWTDTWKIRHAMAFQCAEAFIEVMEKWGK